MKRKLICLMMILMLSLPITQAWALEEPDMARTGSIGVAMTCEGEAVAGGMLTIYRAGQIHEENGADFSFRLTAEFAGSGLSLSDIYDAALAPALAEYAGANGLSGIQKEIDDKGLVTFEDLELGLYLVVQTTPAPGYFAADPFLVSVPGRKDGSYIYHVDASPKLALEKDPTPPPPPPPPSIPQTGLTQWPVPVMAAGGLLLVLLGVVCIRSGRKNRYEK